MICTSDADSMYTTYKLLDLSPGDTWVGFLYFIGDSLLVLLFIDKSVSLILLVNLFNQIVNWN